MSELHATNGEGQRFPATLRVKRSEDFGEVFRGGRIASDSVLVVHAVSTLACPTQLGLSVSKKVGSAPVRNHWKRLIREAFRKNYSQLPSEIRLIVRPKKGASANYHAIEVSLCALAQRVSKQLQKRSNKKRRTD